MLPIRHALASSTLHPLPFRKPLEASAVFWSLRRAPQEQLAGCRERGSSKGARSRMLRAKKCKQVEPLHYMAPPLHSQTLPPTVFFYADVSHAQTPSHTKSSAFCHHFFLSFFFQSYLPAVCAAVGPQDHKTASQISLGCLFFTKYLVKQPVPGLCACVGQRMHACRCMEKLFNELSMYPHHSHFLPAQYLSNISLHSHFASTWSSIFLFVLSFPLDGQKGVKILPHSWKLFVSHVQQPHLFGPGYFCPCEVGGRRDSFGITKVDEISREVWFQTGINLHPECWDHSSK